MLAFDFKYVLIQYSLFSFRHSNASFASSTVEFIPVSHRCCHSSSASGDLHLKLLSKLVYEPLPKKKKKKKNNFIIL